MLPLPGDTNFFTCKTATEENFLLPRFKIFKFSVKHGGTWFQNSGGRGRYLSEFEDSLIYKMSSRTARYKQGDLVSKIKLMFSTALYSNI